MDEITKATRGDVLPPLISSVLVSESGDAVSETTNPWWFPPRLTPGILWSAAQLVGTGGDSLIAEVDG